MSTGLSAVFLTPMAAIACTLPADWTPMKAEGDQSIRAAVSKPAAIPVGEPFAIGIAVCAPATTSFDRIKVDAVMPSHRHGMNYKPKVARTVGNRFRAESMLFHMPGLWRITMTAYKAGKPAHFSLDIMVK